MGLYPHRKALCHDISFLRPFCECPFGLKLTPLSTDTLAQNSHNASRPSLQKERRRNSSLQGFAGYMDVYLVGFMLCLFTFALCKSDIPIGYQATIPVPHVYNTAFIGRAFIMEASSVLPSFRAALTVEAIDGAYSCSLGVFLGDFRVWNSGHFLRFHAKDSCRLQLTKFGDLQLKDSNGSIGWRTATSRQDVERLQLLKTGNLVLTDAMNQTKWQSFNIPTNVMLWGQRLSISTSLTSFSSNSFEIQTDRIALYLNSGKGKYSYWEYKLSQNRSIAFAELASTGLKLFDDQGRKLAQLLPNAHEPLRFLTLDQETGNMKLYHYSPDKRKFEASFGAINSTCDLPLACGPYGICTFSNSCACIQLTKKTHGNDPNCRVGFSNKFCRNRSPVELAEIAGVDSIFRVPIRWTNISKDECLSLCIHDCKCAAVLYSITEGVCFHFEFVRGLKQVKHGNGLTYMIKVPKGIGRKKSSVKNWLWIVGGIVDGLVIVFVVAGFGYYYLVAQTRSNPG